MAILTHKKKRRLYYPSAVGGPTVLTRAYIDYSFPKWPQDNGLYETATLIVQTANDLLAYMAPVVYARSRGIRTFGVEAAAFALMENYFQWLLSSPLCKEPKRGKVVIRFVNENETVCFSRRGLEGFFDSAKVGPKNPTASSHILTMTGASISNRTKIEIHDDKEARICTSAMEAGRIC
jgi:hypothetical protein